MQKLRSHTTISMQIRAVYSVNSISILFMSGTIMKEFNFIRLLPRSTWMSFSILYFDNKYRHSGLCWLNSAQWTQSIVRYHSRNHFDWFLWKKAIIDHFIKVTELSSRHLMFFTVCFVAALYSHFFCDWASSI